MNLFKKNLNLLNGILLGLVTFAIVASPFSLSTRGISLRPDIAYAATAKSVCDSFAVGVTTSYLTNNSDGTFNCHITLGDSPGPEYKLNADGSVAGSSVTIGNTTQNYDANSKPITTVTDCSAFLIAMANPFTCMFRSLVSNTAALLIWISTWLLTFAGALFNWLVDNTIVHFGNVYSSAVQNAVQNAWTAFRDIANILIIGIFAFIAISIILGLKQFGQKKLIANVLIVAVLINFSLLFTKIIIDASNFTATQIYSAAALGTVSSVSSNTTVTSVGDTKATASGSSAGIGGQFIYLLGVQSFSDTKSALENIAQANDNGWIALFHGLFVFVILVAAAAVLFYGSFLLVARVILIIFLMVTASVAFASYLVPKWQSSHYGWDTWWSSLIKSAVFAPVLMFFLWMTLSVSWAIHGTAGSGSFGDMIANPTKTSDTGVFVNYAVILGLLFISFKLSSTFAGKISGFNLAALVPAFGAGVLGKVAGFAGRQTIGRAGMYVGDKLQSRAKNTESALARQALDFGSRKFNTLGKRDFNFMRGGLGGAIAKTAGTKVDTIAGKDLKGFEGRQKDFLKSTAEQARRLTLSPDEKKAIKEKGLDKTLRENADLAQRYAEAEKTQNEHKDLEETLRKDRDTTGIALGNAIKEAIGEVDTHKAAVAAAPIGTEEHTKALSKLTEAEEKLAVVRKDAKTKLDEQSQRIKEANRTAQSAGRALQTATEEAEKFGVASGAIPKRAYKDAGELAEEITKSSLSALLTKATAISPEGRDKLAAKAKKEAGTQEKKHHLEETGVLSALKDLAKDDHGDGHGEKKGGDHGGGDHGGGGGGGHAETHAPTPAPAAPAAPSGGGDHGGGGGGGHGH